MIKYTIDSVKELVLGLVDERLKDFADIEQWQEELHYIVEDIECLAMEIEKRAEELADVDIEDTNPAHPDDKAGWLK